jgi:hypothetical protein
MSFIKLPLSLPFFVAVLPSSSVVVSFFFLLALKKNYRRLEEKNFLRRTAQR